MLRFITGTVTTALWIATAAAQTPPPPAETYQAKDPVDRQRVIDSGLTTAEADCWDRVTRFGAAYFALPKLPRTDNAGIVAAIHVVQNHLLMRPVYRKYRELATSAGQARPDTAAPPEADPIANAIDRQRAIDSGLTPAEAECWDLVSRFAQAYFGLPKLHPSENREVAQALHVVQDKLLMRPAYRRYMDLSKPK